MILVLTVVFFLALYMSISYVIDNINAILNQSKTGLETTFKLFQLLILWSILFYFTNK